MKAIIEEDSENHSASTQNILANSIRNARSILEKKQYLGHSLCSSAGLSTSGGHNSHNMKQSKRRQSNSSSAAQAIKVLHERIAHLEAFNTQLTLQTNKNKKQLNLKTQQIQTYQMQLENCLSAQNNFYKKIDQKQSIIQELQQKIKTKDSQHSYSIQQNKQLRELVKSLKQKHNNIDKQVKDMNKRLDTYQKLTAKQICELQEEKQKNRELVQKIKSMNTHEKSRETITFPAIIDSPLIEGSCNFTNDNIILSSNAKQYSATRNRSTSGITYQPTSKTYLLPIEGEERKSKKQKNSRSKERDNKIEGKIQQQINQYRLKVKNLTQMLNESNKRYEQQLHHKKIIQGQNQNLKSLTRSIIDQINLLPTNLVHKFKIWIVKFRKISTNMCSSDRCSRIMRRDISYSGSKQRQSRSKSKKPLKMEDLNISQQYSCYSRSNSKSRKNYNRNSNHIHSSNSGKKHHQRLKLQRNRKMRNENDRIQNKGNLPLKQQINKIIKLNCKKIHQIEARLNQHEQDEAVISLLKKDLEKLYQENQQLQNNGN